ncbi:hypothetical protein HDZ31DRAFT_46542 [Schizophyllum fasciatum]
MPPDTGGTFVIPTLKSVVTTPQKHKTSAQPLVIVSAAKERDTSQGTKFLGYHAFTDPLLSKELFDCSFINIPNLAKIALPDDAFQIPLDEFWKAMISGPLPMYRSGRWTTCPDLTQANMERPLASLLEQICDVARRSCQKDDRWILQEKRHWSADWCDKPLAGGVTSRKPDVVAGVISLLLDWTSLRVDLQHKANVNKKADVAMQLHDGALNSLSSQDDRCYHIGIGMTGEDYFMNYYDRTGCLRSEPHNIHKRPKEFLRILLGLTLLDKRYLGYDPTIKARDNGRFVTVNGVEYEIVERVDEWAGIVGLGTVCWLCKCTSDGEQAVIKNSWTDPTRKHPESHYLRRAAEAKVQGVPTLVAYERVEYGGRPITTAIVREQLRTVPDAAKAGARVLTRLVMKEYGMPLHCFASRTEFLSAFLDCVIAHMGMHDDVGALHSDVHDKNVMLNNDSKPGERRGLLVDFNYAIPVGETRDKASAGWRSCPPIFRACELLESPGLITPEFHHDLESFFVIFLWICIWFSGPGGMKREFDVMETDIGSWLHIDAKVVAGRKISALRLKAAKSDTFGNFLNNTFHPYFDILKPCAWDLRQEIMREDPRPSYERVIAILKRHLEYVKRIELGSSQATGNRMNQPDDSSSGLIDSTSTSESDVFRAQVGMVAFDTEGELPGDMEGKDIVHLLLIAH